MLYLYFHTKTRGQALPEDSHVGASKRTRAYTCAWLPVWSCRQSPRARGPGERRPSVGLVHSPAAVPLSPSSSSPVCAGPPHWEVCPSPPSPSRRPKQDQLGVPDLRERVLDEPSQAAPHDAHSLRLDNLFSLQDGKTWRLWSPLLGGLRRSCPAGRDSACGRSGPAPRGAAGLTPKPAVPNQAALTAQPQDPGHPSCPS